MIRKYEKEDIGCIVEIWYKASVNAHDFVSADFWENEKESMRNIYIPSSETYTLVENKEIIGFISLQKEVLAAIFIDPKKQGKGRGGELMKYAFSLRDNLTLNVYSENYSAINFYKKYGFNIQKEGKCLHTGAMELTMTWQI